MVSSLQLLLAIILSATDDPSFNCRLAKTVAETLVCTAPALAALDRELANVFNNTVHQGGIDGKKLRREEEVWVAHVRDACVDVRCVGDAYEDRLETLRDQSLRAASLAVYEATRPFKVSDKSIRAARARIGSTCSRSGDIPGFDSVAGFLPILFNGYVVYARRIEEDRFAFLVKLDALSTCVVSDVVSLPSASAANSFLSCGGPDVPSPGVGLRSVGNRALLAYWFVDLASGKFQRQPMDVLDADRSTRCREPENGE